MKRKKITRRDGLFTGKRGPPSKIGRDGIRSGEGENRHGVELERAGCHRGSLRQGSSPTSRLLNSHMTGGKTLVAGGHKKSGLFSLGLIALFRSKITKGEGGNAPKKKKNKGRAGVTGEIEVQPCFIGERKRGGGPAVRGMKDSRAWGYRGLAGRTKS